MNHDLDTPVVDWLIDYPVVEPLLKAWGVDCSCGGKSLGYACLQQSLSPEKVLEKLLLLIESPSIGSSSTVPETESE